MISRLSSSSLASSSSSVFLIASRVLCGTKGWGAGRGYCATTTGGGRESPAAAYATELKRRRKAYLSESLQRRADKASTLLKKQRGEITRVLTKNEEMMMARRAEALVRATTAKREAAALAAAIEEYKRGEGEHAAMEEKEKGKGRLYVKGMGAIAVDQLKERRHKEMVHASSGWVTNDEELRQKLDEVFPACLDDDDALEELIQQYGEDGDENPYTNPFDSH